MIKPRDLHEITDYEFDLLDDRQGAVVTFRTTDDADHSFLLPREIVERLSAEIAQRLADKPPRAGDQ